MNDLIQMLKRNIYIVSVPEAFVESDAHIELRGKRITGNKKYDEEMRFAWRRIGCNILDMIRYFKNGVDIRIERADTVKIYETVNSYLNQRKGQIIHGSLNLMDPDIDDINDIDIDNFANSIHDRAKWEVKRDEVDNPLAMAMRKAGGIVSSAPFTYRPEGLDRDREDGIVRINEGDERPSRESDEDFFRRHLAGLGVFR